MNPTRYTPLPAFAPTPDPLPPEVWRPGWLSIWHPSPGPLALGLGLLGVGMRAS